MPEVRQVHAASAEGAGMNREQQIIEAELKMARQEMARVARIYNTTPSRDLSETYCALLEQHRRSVRAIAQARDALILQMSHAGKTF
jgi:hypothetical protein